jgi:hypothetical protein
MGIKSISTIQVVQKSDYDRLFNVLSDYYSLSDEDYQEPIWEQSIF